MPRALHEGFKVCFLVGQLNISKKKKKKKEGGQEVTSVMNQRKTLEIT